MPRTTKAYASAYDRSRIQVVRVRRQEKREFIADFSAVIGDEAITSAYWQVNCPSVFSMSSGAIGGKTVTILGDCQLGGIADVKVTITTDGGSKYNQVFEVEVRDCPSFPDEPQVTAGPFSLTVTP